MCSLRLGKTMGAAFGQILRSLAHVCEDAEWHSKCCNEESRCTCDAETHSAGGEVERDVVAGVGCCFFEAHEGPNEHEE